MAHSQSCSFLPSPSLSQQPLTWENSIQRIEVQINTQLQIQGQNSVLCHLPIFSYNIRHSPGKKNMARLNMSELVDYDRKCCLIFCFSATHITNCLAAIHSFTLSVNSYSAKLDEAVQATKALLRFSAPSCPVGKLESFKGKWHTGRERLVGPPKDLLSFGQVKFTCLLGACVFIISMSP